MNVNEIGIAHKNLILYPALRAALLVVFDCLVSFIVHPVFVVRCWMGSKFLQFVFLGLGEWLGPALLSESQLIAESTTIHQRVGCHCLCSYLTIIHDHP